MPQVPFPASGGVFEAFVERARFSPNARIDIDWLVTCLGITQTTNARRTLRWLEAAGIVEKGRLTDLGLDLLGLPNEPTYRQAASEALENLMPDGVLKELREGNLSQKDFQSRLNSLLNVGPSTLNKALAGFRVLAEASGDPELVRGFGRAPYDKHKPVSQQIQPEVAKDAILQKFQLFTGATGGIDAWLSKDTPPATFERLMEIPQKPLTKAQLNQLLTLAHAAPIDDGFFSYYWLTIPDHTYDLTSLPHYSEDWSDSEAIFSLDQLHWGLYRFYVDALLYFGNVRAAYQALRSKAFHELHDFFLRHAYDTRGMVSRGPSLPLQQIDRNDRYLISEMACKSYAPAADDDVRLDKALKEAFADYRKRSSEPISVSHLLDEKAADNYIMIHYPDSQGVFEFSADEILGEQIQSEDDLDRILIPIMGRFEAARNVAIKNTELYLSSVGEMDVYVATSMRKPSEFHAMTDFCEQVFRSRQLRKYDLRYFDPTLSAAENHQDKGLIECLMVNCAKVLIYTAGTAESYGKDAEAAMALSLGKPVIFYCSETKKRKFYKEVHPLSRLIDFSTGVAVGAIVTDSPDEVIELLDRLFTNSMQYSLEQKKPGYLVLTERVTGSVVRLQTSDKLLRETFWNHYQIKRENIN